MAARIEDYALIGDCQTAALVSRGGSIDWLCWPRFDSGACFAALLGTPENGYWRIAPVDGEATVSRRYRSDTLILDTEFRTREGTVVLTDFMPLRGTTSDVVRIVRGTSGTVQMACDLVIRCDYGATIPWVTRTDGGALRAISGPDMLVLHTPVKLVGKDMKTRGEFTVRAGDSVPFALIHAASHAQPPDPIDVDKALIETQRFWEGWTARCESAGPYSDAVKRSLITLKALTYAPTGGMVAAATTSLPEHLGGTRNWDYRICWLRDATLTLLSLMNAGYFDEARAWRDWLMRAAAGAPAQTQIMYGLAGERRLMEHELPWLSGYENSRPVRIGNAAAQQLQLDVYGEVMDALHQARVGGLQHFAEGWDFQRALLTHLESIWQEPDEGIWEVRGPRQHFTFSKVMCWVAFDRAIKSVEAFGLPGPVERWRKLRAQIHDDVCDKAFNPGIGAFTQAYGSTLLDASALLLENVGFVAHDDPRMVGTIAAIERSLMRDGLVLRYHTSETEDGLPPGEGAFLACSFWLADAYVLAGRRDEARRLFERLLAIRNDVGLLAEEYDPRACRLLGNFPQAFSHVGLVNTAHNLVRATKPSEQRSGRVATSETG
jgi:GH15 family glucan-1,4-alpha-glucosidase